MRMCKVLIAALFAFALPAFSAPVTLQSDWRVLSVSDTNGLLDDIFQVGTDMSVSTTFESGTPDGNPSANRGEYDNAITNITLHIGSSTFSGNGSILIRNIGPSGYLFGQRTTVANPEQVMLFTFNSDSDLMPQLSDSLEWLTTAPKRVDSSNATLYFGSSIVGFIQMGEYRVAEVPVPGAFLLFSSGIALLAAVRPRLWSRNK